MIEKRCRPRITNGKRAFIYNRDHYKCLKCNSTSGITLDHIIPWSLGGTNRRENLQTLCTRCNVDKGDSYLWRNI